MEIIPVEKLNIAFAVSAVLSLPPSHGNPRNSEGDFIKLKDGRIMFIYSRYVGTSSSDHAPAYLAARFPADGGKGWWVLHGYMKRIS